MLTARLSLPGISQTSTIHIRLLTQVSDTHHKSIECFSSFFLFDWLKGSGSDQISLSLPTLPLMILLSLLFELEDPQSHLLEAISCTYSS